MTTRSGLSIQKVPVKRSNRIRGLKVSPTSNAKSLDKCPVVKYKSMSYMSFVTRFYIGLRVPNLELAGMNPRETIQYFETSSHPYRASCSSYDDNENYSESSCDEWETDSEEEINHDNVFNKACSENTEYNMSETNTTTNFVVSCARDNNVLDYFNSDRSVDLADTESVNVTGDKNDNSVFSDALSNDSDNDDDVSISTFDNHDDSDSISSISVADSEESGKLVMDFRPCPTFDSTALRCDECDRIFATLAAFSTHLRSHHVKAKNSCDVCGKVFTRSWLLKGHMRTHTGERPFKCPSPGCDKAFADKSNLRSHMMIHSVTSKNFSCQKCGRAFAQKRYLHKHMLEVCRI